MTKHVHHCPKCGKKIMHELPPHPDLKLVHRTCASKSAEKLRKDMHKG